MNFVRSQLFLILLMSFCWFGYSQNKSKQLVGKWEWIESSGGITGGIMTPKSEGYTIQSEFTKKGIYRSYKDGLLNLQMKYKVVLIKSVLSGAESYMVHYQNVKGQNLSMVNDSFEFRGKDTLILKEECHDCYTRIFVRSKK